MKAKKVNENFERGLEPKKSLHIGWNTISEYVDYQLKENGIDPDNYDFWDYFNENLDSWDKDELIEMIHEIIGSTPMEYQINWIKKYLDQFIGENE